MRSALAIALCLLALPASGLAQEGGAEDGWIPAPGEEDAAPDEAAPDEAAPDEAAPDEEAPPTQPERVAPVEPAPRRTQTSPPPAQRRAEPPPAARPRMDDRGNDAQPPPPAFEEEEEPAPDGGDPYDFFWVELFGGLSYVDLRALSQNNFYPEFVRLQGEGPAGGAAVGFRIEFVSIGVRAAVAHYGDEFDVGTAIGEIALRLPLPVVKPYLRAGFGFAWHGDSDYMAPASSQTTVFGWAFSAAVGLDIYLVEWFAIGAALNVDLLNMSRTTFNDPMPAPGEVVFEDPGDAVGAQIRGQIAVSFHF